MSNPNNVIRLRRSTTPGGADNSGGSLPQPFSPVAFLKRSELTQTIIDCLAVVFALAFFVITSLGTVAALAVLLFFSVH